MKNNMVIRNRFCSVSEAKFRKWDEIDVLFWKLGRNDVKGRSGGFYLNAYKDAYVQYNRIKSFIMQM